MILGMRALSLGTHSLQRLQEDRRESANTQRVSTNKEQGLALHGDKVFGT